MAQTNQQKERSEADKKFEQINIAPHSIEAEQAILGGIMLNSETLDSVAERIQPSDFYNKTHEFIFSQMLQLAKEGQPIDLLTIDQALKDKGILEDAGRFAYLAELSKNTPSVANILAYADIVSECAIRRELISASNKIAEISYSPKGMTVKDVLDEAERTVFHIAEKRTSSDEGPKKLIAF
ncbi:Replicative DNA helicase [Bibersteinia trehalosi USDA-ARS-USMARC-189]|uniref:Replicative DNA helicase n=1 Tax=Bibersteinia trehalosi USDA-ARS-USMARC-189 TaxID=1263831 RepID=A0ABN4BY32_BIBTR|nr:Replicative DNA helicase [Bibersteinia trehalosi USDA-ARS-USMARC-189]